MIANRGDGYFIVPIKEGYPKLNGRSIRRNEQLKHGDVIDVGGTTLIFENNSAV